MHWCARCFFNFQFVMFDSLTVKILEDSKGQFAAICICHLQGQKNTPSFFSPFSVFCLPIISTFLKYFLHLVLLFHSFLVSFNLVSLLCLYSSEVLYVTIVVF